MIYTHVLRYGARGVRSPLDAMVPAALRDPEMEPPARYTREVARLRSVLHDIDREGTSRAMRHARPEMFRFREKDVNYGVDHIPKTTLVSPHCACVAGYADKAL
jgi:hypothetical protein